MLIHRLIKHAIQAPGEGDGVVSTGGASAEPAAQETSAPEQAGNDQPQGDQGAEKSAEAAGEEGAEQGEKQPEKKEKTFEEKEIARLRRRVDNLTRRLHQGAQQVASTDAGESDRNAASQDDSESLSLSRKELRELINQEAQKLAPAINQQEAEDERRRDVVKQLAKTWGQEKFDALASDLDDAFGGLTHGIKGQLKPATEALFAADDPAPLIEYLTDPENSVEAEAIARMSAVQAGRAIAKLESKLDSKKADAKPKPSKVPPPIEALRGGGNSNGMPDPANTKAWIKWANQQERRV